MRPCATLNSNGQCLRFEDDLKIHPGRFQAKHKMFHPEKFFRQKRCFETE